MALLKDIGPVVLTTANNYQELTMNPFPGLFTALQFNPPCGAPARPVAIASVDAAPDFHDGLQAALLDQIALGLIVCDQRATLCFANEAARQELDGERVLRLCGGSLRCANGRSAALDLALRQAATKGRRQLLALNGADDRLMVTLIPLTRDDGSEPRVLLVLGRRGACSTLGLEMLAGVYGLTLAERRVLGGLVGEVSPQDIAEAGGVSLSTVRTQIAAIRTKFGVRNVEGLLIRAAEVPMVPGALRSQRPPAGGVPTLAARAVASHPPRTGERHVELQ